MMTFKEMHKRYFTFMSAEKANKKLNDFEVRLFDKMPWIMPLDENQQNDLIEFYLEAILNKNRQ